MTNHRRILTGFPSSIERSDSATYTAIFTSPLSGASSRRDEAPKAMRRNPSRTVVVVSLKGSFEDGAYAVLDLFTRLRSARLDSSLCLLYN